MGKSNVIRLVIVDDHEVVRIGLSAVLNLTPGLKVVGQATRKKDAKELCQRLQPDLALLDIRLSDGSGVDAARDILACSPHTRILFLTSFADDHTVTEAILSGAHGYILKDISSQALVRAIKTVASGHALIDPRLTAQTRLGRKDSIPQQASSKRSLLSPQEQRLLPLVAEGLTNREIAQILKLSEKTVKNYLSKVCAKLQVGRRSQIASFYASSFKGAGTIPLSANY